MAPLCNGLKNELLNFVVRKGYCDPCANFKKNHNLLISFDFLFSLSAYANTKFRDQRNFVGLGTIFRCSWYG